MWKCLLSLGLPAGNDGRRASERKAIPTNTKDLGWASAENTTAGRGIWQGWKISASNRILTFPRSVVTIDTSVNGAWRSLASALAWGARGPRFKSGRPDWFSAKSGSLWPPNVGVAQKYPIGKVLPRAKALGFCLALNQLPHKRAIVCTSANCIQRSDHSPNHNADYFVHFA